MKYPAALEPGAAARALMHNRCLQTTEIGTSGPWKFESEPQEPQERKIAHNHHQYEYSEYC